VILRDRVVGLHEAVENDVAGGLGAHIEASSTASGYRCAGLPGRAGARPRLAEGSKTTGDPADRSVASNTDEATIAACGSAC
jgi:hypothetical protein